MSDRTGREAADAYFASLREAISSVTQVVLFRIPLPETRGWLTTIATTPATLRGPTVRAFITFDSEYTVQKDDQTGTPLIVLLTYQYILFDAEATEIIAYPWHPTGESRVVAPHLHAAATHRSLDLSKAHLPTGVVEPHEVIRCPIGEFGVEPLRPDWDQILRDA